MRAHSMSCRRAAAERLRRARESVAGCPASRYARRVVSSTDRSPILGRAGVCLIALALVLATSSLCATGALGAGFEGGGALNELTQGNNESTQTQTTATTSSTSTEATNSKSLVLIALGAAVVVLCGIAYVIVRDARRVAPAGEEDLMERRSGRDPAVALARRRAKAKAARRQRKRNR
jgi:ABC-type Fe3+ transport system permease subunit